MMVEPVGRQDRLSYEFDLEDLVPGDNPLCRAYAVLDLRDAHVGRSRRRRRPARSPGPEA